jgi:hypothetical protein
MFLLSTGPVAENIKDQHAKTTNEFSNLAASRTTPAKPAATGQQLTHYHSFFSTLLSWDNPRASGIAYVSVVTFIFAARYLNILRYAFKATWMTLAVTITAEVLGKAVLGQGLSSQFRPKKYFTISKSTLDSLTGDLHELINFFVIESQRIVFAENVFASVAVSCSSQCSVRCTDHRQAFLGAFTSYYLIKIVPLWGLALLSTSILFLSPLVYKTNKELIDHHINNVSNVINQQTDQVKQLASHHAARATDATKQYVGDYSAKAQEMIGNARARSTSPVASAKPAKVDLKENTPGYKSEDFPAAPKEDFKSVPHVQDTVNALKTEDEPLIAT